jgi:hypothetical protein
MHRLLKRSVCWPPAGLVPLHPELRLQLLVLPDAYTSPRQHQVRVGESQQPILPYPRPFKRWTTPRHGMIDPCNFCTERSWYDLPTQVRFEAGTAEDARAGTVAAPFLEWLMGYPTGCFER